MPKADISIVIVNYNVKDFLSDCLQSIRKSKTKLNIQTIVVDNNSSDGSVHFLEPLFPEVEFYALEENLGFGKANNYGFDKSEGDYILILNPDTILHEDTLQMMYEYMEANQDVGMSGCKVLNADGTFQVACRRGFPTPWASFTKLFGLQKLFPKSKLFSKYNQLFRSVDETYEIDVLIGAFMFARKEVIEATKGFDPAYFMYAEDIDLCYRTKELGWKVMYYHETSIIHYKGESTKRSAINDVKHFYNAMEIFAKKYYSKSFMLFLFLKLGIVFRTLIAYLNKYRRELYIIFTDLFFINASLLISTKYRFGEFFNFPDYAYPTVFIILSLILSVSMILFGDHFSSKPNIRKAAFAHMISFFVLSSFTYFFKEEWGFSRGILLMTSGLGIFFSSLSRTILSLYDKIIGSESERRILIVGINEKTKELVNRIQTSDKFNFDIVGLANIKADYNLNGLKIPVLGSMEYLPKIIKEHKISELVITDESVSQTDIIDLVARTSNPNVRYHIANKLEDFIAAKIINDISGFDPSISSYGLADQRLKVLKRIMDISVSMFLMTIGLPILYLINKNGNITLRNLLKVLKGTYSLIGLYDQGEKKKSIGKTGLIALAHITKPEQLSKDAIRKLNEDYAKHYSLSLDFDIIFKFIFRVKRGK